MKRIILFTAVICLFALCSKASDKSNDNQNSAFNCGTSTVTDNDGNVYNTVLIDNQCWMKENLNFATPSGSWCYENNSANCNKYGRLYNWKTAKTACPNGWHLPDDNEWSQLINFLGDENFAGGKLKATGTIEAGTGLWNDPNSGATNQTGFTALPGGGYGSGTFVYLGSTGYWWSATGSSFNRAYYRIMSNNSATISRISYSKSMGYSVRCVRD